MKVLLICKGEYRYLFPGIADALQTRYGARVSAVAFASTTELMLERTHNFHRVFNLAQWLKVQEQDSSLAECVELLRQFETFSRVRINTIVHADRIIRAYPESDAIRMLANTLQFWRYVCLHYAPDVIVGEVACAAEWIGWLVAHSAGIRYVIPYPTPVPHRFFFIDRPDGTWEKMEAAFRNSIKRKLSTDQSAAAENCIQSFRTKKTKPPFLEWAQHSPLRPEPSRFVRRLARIPFRIRTHFSDGRFEIGSYHGTSPWRPVREDAARIVRHAVSEAGVFSHQLDHTKHNVYFPLHVQPEFTTDVRSPFHANQLAIVENISKSVPIGYTVLVKEHPGMRGERPLVFYRQLKKLHNVRLLSPDIDSHDLIRTSDVVFTITGTTAWEAILYEKPVIAFGPLCYGFYDLVHHCKNIADVPEILSKALDQFTPDHDLLLKFVCAFLESAYELEWGDPIRRPQVTAKSNCDRIADAIVAELSSATRSRCEGEILAHR